MRLSYLFFPVIFSAGCGGSMSSARYVATTHAPGFDDLQVGKRVAIDAAPGDCAGTKTADDPDLLLSGGGTSVGGVAWAAASLWTIKDSRVSTEHQSVALQLASDDGKDSHWISLPNKGASSCVYPVDSSALASFTARVGTKLVFAPWMPSCTVLEAAGPSAQALLFDSDPGSSLPVTSVTVAPGAAAGGGSPVPWLVFAKGAVRARADVAGACFAAEGSDDATPPAGARAFLRTTKEQCPSDKVDGKPHVACRTSVGVWEGTTSDTQISLRLVRRTLGPIHFVGGKPVSREAFASAVVAVRFGAAKDQRETALYVSLEGAVRAGLAGQGGLVRATTAGDSSATMELYVGASQLTIGDLQTSETNGQTTYKDHQETHANPKKAELRQSVTQATTQMNNASNEIQQAEQRVREAEQTKQEEEQLKQQALQTCRDEAGRISNALQRNLALSACTVGEIAVNPNGGVPEAQQALTEARNHLSEAQGRKAAAETELAAAPDTITEWVMMPWSYKKKTVTRTVSVQLETRVTPKGGTATAKTEPVLISLTDYQVDEDAKHNVSGHAPDANIVQTPDNLVPQIAVKLADRLGASLHHILTEEQQAAALGLFAKAGGEAAREEYRKVDATAFEAVGARLQRATRRGTGTATSAGLSLPASLVEIGAHGCMLAVAVAEEPSDGALKLSTPTGSHADLRGSSAALVELCADDGPPPDVISVTSDANVKVRWGLYLLHGESR